LNIPYKKTKDGILLKIKVEPRSSMAGIQGVSGNTLKVKLTSAPVDGAANRQLIEILAKKTGVRKSSIEIVRGDTSKNKVVLIRGIESI
jgi:hypothetical protein